MQKHFIYCQEKKQTNMSMRKFKMFKLLINILSHKLLKNSLQRKKPTFNWLRAIVDQCHLEDLREDDGADVDLDLWAVIFSSRTEDAIFERLWNP